MPFQSSSLRQPQYMNRPNRMCSLESKMGSLIYCDSTGMSRPLPVSSSNNGSSVPIHGVGHRWLRSLIESSKSLAKGNLKTGHWSIGTTRDLCEAEQSCPVSIASGGAWLDLDPGPKPHRLHQEQGLVGLYA